MPNLELQTTIAACLSASVSQVCEDQLDEYMSKYLSNALLEEGDLVSFAPSLDDKEHACELVVFLRSSLVETLSAYGICDGDETTEEELLQDLSSRLLSAGVGLKSFANALESTDPEKETSQKLDSALQGLSILEMHGEVPTSTTAPTSDGNPSETDHKSSRPSSKKNKSSKKDKKGKKGKGRKKSRKTSSSSAASDGTAELEDRLAAEEKYDEEWMVDDHSILLSRGRAPVGCSMNVFIKGVSIAVKNEELLVDTTLNFLRGHRYGLVGRNGTGKSTLLKRMQRQQIKDFPSYLRVLHVKQEVPAVMETPVEYVVNTDTERTALMKEEQDILEKLETAQSSEELTERLTEIYERLEFLEADRAEMRAEDVLKGLRFSKAKINSPIAELSGGWRMRVALAAALFLEPDILLLDEPDNHLDMEAILWLQTYLQSYEGTVIVVSHDKEFLNAVTTDTIHLFHKTLRYYHGNYATFEKDVAEKKKKYAAIQENVDRQREKAKETIQRIQRSVKKGGDQKKLGTVASRKKKIERTGMEKTENGFRWKVISMGDRVGSVNGSKWWQANRPITEAEDKPIKMTLPDVADIGVDTPLIQVQKVSFSYGDGAASKPDGSHLLNDVTMDITIGSRVVLLGTNGSGKSTLLKMIAGSLKPTSGKIYRHHNLEMSVFGQHHEDDLNLQLTPLEHMQKLFPLQKELDLRSHLGRYGVAGSMVLRPIGTLSGGQKARVTLASLTITNPHIFVMDEATNHLDMDTIDALLDGLKKYEGGLVIVSHNQRLISELGKELWEVKSGRVTRLEYDFDTYRSNMIERVSRES